MAITKAVRKRKSNVEKTRGGGRYTEAGFFGFIRSGLRSKWSRWPPRFDVLADAKRPYVGTSVRTKYAYECAICKKLHPQKEVEVDHLVPCGTLKTFEDLPTFVSRLFVEKEHLRVLCKPCLLVITAEERAAK